MKLSGFSAKKDIISASSTAVIWILMLVLSLAVKPEQEPRYETIQLILEEENMPENIPEPVPVQKVIEQPKQQEIKEVSVEKKESPAPVKQPQTAQETQSKTPAPAPAKKPAAAPAEKMAEPKLVQSMDDLIAQNARQVKKEAVWDESMFEESAVEQRSQDPAVPKINSNEPVNELSGSAASSQTDTGAKASVSSRTASSSPVMSTTEKALQTISSTKPGTYTAQGTDKGISFDTQSSSRSEGDGIAMDLEDGTSRRLIYPSKPVIVLSAESEKLITSSITLTIVFTVLANGTVSPGNVRFQPAGILPVIVQAEIRAQIGQWRFEEEKSDGQARLTYSINVK